MDWGVNTSVGARACVHTPLCMRARHTHTHTHVQVGRQGAVAGGAQPADPDDVSQAIRLPGFDALGRAGERLLLLDEGGQALAAPAVDADPIYWLRLVNLEVKSPRESRGEELLDVTFYTQRLLLHSHSPPHVGGEVGSQGWHGELLNVRLDLRFEGLWCRVGV